MALPVVQDLIASSTQRVVFGLGPTGLSVARFLHRSGEAFSVVDTRSAPPCLEQLREEMPEVPVFTGDIPESVLTGAGQLVVSPGIALDERHVAGALEAGVPVLGDIDLFVAAATAPVVGITGSNAKSTVTALVGEMAQAAGLNTGVGGNLGPPALDLLAPERELYVVELSSFQLERAGRLDLRLATVLNMSADHLDRHGSMPRYHQAKHRIFRGCQTAVVNRDDPLTVPLVEDGVNLISWGMGEPDLENFGLRLIDGVEFLCRGFDPLLASAALPLPGRHNIANALAALAIGHGIGLPLEAMQAGLANFRGLSHRCELVVEAGGVRWVNDSKGTNVGATAAALRGLGGDRNLILIAGGQAKGADFSALKQPLSSHGRLLITIGEDAGHIEAAVGDALPTRRAESLAQAVAMAAEAAQSGDTVLLSPACASFDMFASYIDRGEQFAELARRLAEERT